MGVLDDMTKGITERKAAKAGKKLTPVGTEASPIKPSLAIPEVPEVFLTNEAVRDIAKDLRRMTGLLTEVADGLDKLTLEDTAAPPPEADVKAAEKAADEAHEARTAKAAEEEEFTERLERLKAEAQAAVFPEEKPDPSQGERWNCPEHGANSLKQLTSRLGREYWACQVAGCQKFEK